MVTNLDEKMRWMLDREEIRACLHRYTRGVDRHDRDLVLSAYHPDALATYGSFEGGPEEVVEWANTGHERTFVAHQHCISNISIELDGDAAHTETYFHIVLRRKVGDGIDVLGGRYLDRFERREDEWRIARRVCIMDWTALLHSDPAAQDRLQAYEPGRWDRSDLSYERPLSNLSS